MHFGEHVTVDGYNGDAKKLNDRELVFKCLDELPGFLGMGKLSKPEVYFAKGNDVKDPGGWSGFVIIMESHISIHTFPARGFLSADVYTCKNGMDTKLIIDYLTKQFGLKDIEQNFIKRGTMYPAKNIS
jgi:S-adenosylmethionine decarboxylase